MEDQQQLPAVVESSGTIARVRPGTGDVVIPPGTTGVVLDLRNLPSTPDLAEALARAVAPALSAPVPRLSRRMRHHLGLTDEYYSYGYDNTVEVKPRPPLTPAGSSDLPIAVVVGEVMQPEVADFALSLRYSQRAWLLGGEVPAQVAESRVTPLPAGALVWRYCDLMDESGQRVPDVTNADGDGADPVAFLTRQPPETKPPAPPAGKAERPPVVQVEPYGQVQPATLGLGGVRAALIVAHATARLFFPYFAVIGDNIDERLLETIGTAEGAPAGELDRRRARDLLRRLGEVLRDGHQSVVDQYGDPSVRGYLALLCDEQAGQMVVRRSLVPGVNAGDTVVSIDGAPVSDLLAAELARTSAATDGHRFFLASYELTTVRASSVALELVDTVGTARTVTVQPSTGTQLQAIGYAASERSSGWLTDLGAPNIYYMNLDGCYALSDAEMRVAIQGLESAAGLILDDRGHPANCGATWNPYELLQRLATEPFTMLAYRIPVFDGPFPADWQSVYDNTFYPLSNPSYGGPVVLLTDPRSVSFAEDMASMFLNAHRGEIVGRPSAGTTGSITGVQLPGGFAFTFTGMEAQWPDGSVFHGVGVAPLEPVPIDPADFANGVDADIAAAIQQLQL